MAEWTKVNILKPLKDEIEIIIVKTTIPNVDRFVDLAIREKINDIRCENIKK